MGEFWTLSLMAILAFFGLVLIRLSINLFGEEPGSALGAVSWIGIPAFIGWGVSNNFGNDAGIVAQGCTIAFLLVYCTYQPHSSELKQALRSGVRVPAIVIAVAGLGSTTIIFSYLLFTGAFLKEGVPQPAINFSRNALAVAAMGLACLGYLEVVERFNVRIFTHRSFHSLSLSWFRFRLNGDPNESSHQGSGSSRNSSQNNEQEQNHSGNFDPGGEEPWWVILEVTQDATLEEAMNAAKNLLKVYHPDKFRTMPHLLKHAEERTKLVLSARDRARRQKKT